MCFCDTFSNILRFQPASGILPDVWFVKMISVCVESVEDSHIVSLASICQKNHLSYLLRGEWNHFRRKLSYILNTFLLLGATRIPVYRNFPQQLWELMETSQPRLNHPGRSPRRLWSAPLTQVARNVLERWRMSFRHLLAG